MEPDKENKYDIKTTVTALHDSGIDIMEGAPAPQENEFSPPGAAPKVGPAQPKPVIPFGQTGQNRPSAQTIIDGVLGIGSVKNQDSSKNDPSIKPIRTFKSDAEEAVKYSNVSKINIAVAEQNRREKEAAPAVDTATNAAQQEVEVGGRSSKIFIFILILGILLGAGTGAYYWFFMMPHTPSSGATTVSVQKGITVKTLIAYDKADTIALEAGKNPLVTIGNKLSATDVPIGQIYALLPLPVGTTTMIANPSTLFASTRIPDRLSRSIAGNYMIGAYFYNLNSPFIILKNTFFQNAFAGMLEWEKDMRNDLISLIRVSYPDEATVSTNNDTFSDMVVSNVDARILRNSTGKIVLAYAFADKDTAVISTNIDTLKYVLDRLLAVRVVQ